MKHDFPLEGNDIELVSKTDMLKVKDELILEVQDCLKEHIAKRVKEVLHSLLAQGDVDHSFMLEVILYDDSVVVGASQ